MQKITKKNQLASYLTLFTKITQRKIKDLNLRCETIKHIEKNIGIKLIDSKGKESKHKHK